MYRPNRFTPWTTANRASYGHRNEEIVLPLPSGKTVKYICIGIGILWVISLFIHKGG